MSEARLIQVTFRPDQLELLRAIVVDASNAVDTVVERLPEHQNLLLASRARLQEVLAMLYEPKAEANAP